MNRRALVKSAILAAVSASAATRQINLEELTVGDIQKGFQSGRITTQSLIAAYLARCDTRVHKT